MTASMRRRRGIFSLQAPETARSRAQVGVVIAGLLVLTAFAGSAALGAAAVAVVAAAIGVLFFVCLGNQWIGLLGTIATLVLLPAPFSVRVGGATLTPGRVLLFALLIGWFMQRRRGDLPLARTPIDLFIWLMLGAMVLSTIANLPRFSSGEFAAVLRKMLLFGVDFFLLFGVTVVALRVKERALIFLRFVTSLIAITAALGIVERLTRRNVFELLAPILPSGVNNYIAGLAEAAVLTRGLVARVHGTFEQPLSFAVVLLMGIPFAIAFGLAAKTRRDRSLWSGAALLMGGALLFTASRGAYLVLAITLVTMLVWAPDWKARRTLFVSMVAFVGLGLLQSDVRDTMSQYLFDLNRGGRLEGGLQNRLDAFDATSDLVADRPFLGFGPGSFAQEQLGQSGLLAGRVDRQVLDNSYLQITGETGAVGLTALAGLLFAIWLMAQRVRTHSVERDDRLVGVAAVASVQAWILFSAFADVYVFNAPPKLFFAIVGAIAVLRKSTTTTGAPAEAAEPDEAEPEAIEPAEPDEAPIDVSPPKTRLHLVRRRASVT